MHGMELHFAIADAGDKGTFRRVTGAIRSKHQYTIPLSPPADFAQYLPGHVAASTLRYAYHYDRYIET